MATAPLTSSSVGLREAAEDGRLFGLELSAKQAELLDTIERTGTTVIACGRQSGKTLCAAVAATHNALLRPDLDSRSRSERHIVTVANSKTQAQILLSFVRSFCERSALLSRRVEQMRDDRISFSNGVTLIAAPCQDRLARGLACSMLAFDEAGWFVTDTDGPRVLERIYAALRPSLVTYGAAARTVMLSTPGQAAFFEAMFRKAEAGELPDAAAFHATSAEMNPTLEPAYLEQERVALGESTFRVEYGAEFLASGAGAFFDEEIVRSVVGRYSELVASEGNGWIVGFDASFSSDPSAAAVVGRRKGERSTLLVAKVQSWQPRRTRHERRAAKSEAERSEVRDYVLDGVAALSRAYGDAPIVADQHMSQVVRDGLRARGVSKVVIQRWSGRSVTQAFQAVRSRMLSDKISLPNDAELVNEFLRIRSSTRSGSAAVTIPRSVHSHCDLAVAVAAAVLYAETHTPARARVYSSFRQGGESVIGSRRMAELEAEWSSRA